MQDKLYHQGRLDCFCGLYAIINATVSGMGNISPLSDADARNLMTHLVENLDARGEFAWVMTEGLTIPELGQLLHVTTDWLRSNFSTEIKRHKPFHCRTAPTIECVSRTINDHLGSVENPSTILMLRRPAKHWTVVSEVSNKGLVLMDSEQEKRPFICCTKAKIGSARHRKTAGIEVIPSGLFLLSFVPQ